VNEYETGGRVDSFVVACVGNDVLMFKLISFHTCILYHSMTLKNRELLFVSS
jgi:hypothetical protein